MQPQTVQHGARALHHAKHGNGREEPEAEDEEQEDDADDARHLESVAQRHVPEHLGQLQVAERQRPAPQIGGRVRDAVEAEFCACR